METLFLFRRALAALLGLALLSAGCGKVAGPQTGPAPVFQVRASQAAIGEKPRWERTSYACLPTISRPWRIVALFPHLKDDYWLAINYGLVAEAKRTGARLEILHAGGYEHLDVQRKQMAEVIDSGRADAIILCGIAADGWDDLIAKAAARGIPVVDSVNGIRSDKVCARTVISLYEQTVSFSGPLSSRHPPGSPPAAIAWFPGPSGADWVLQEDRGFHDACARASVSILGPYFGDTGLRAQSELVVKALDAHPEIQYIAGTAVTIQAAIPILRERKLEGKVHLLSSYLSPGVWRGLERGQILAAGCNFDVLLGRISFDQALCLLEKQPVMPEVRTTVQLLTPEGMTAFDRTDALAPDMFMPVYFVNAVETK